jgi:hypothetical protein
MKDIFYKSKFHRCRTPEEASSDSSDLTETTKTSNNSSEGTTDNLLSLDDTNSHHQNTSEDTEESDEMKRSAAKKLIERYFYQLIDGCGNAKCNNKYCASSGEVDKLTPNQAAARAIQLFSQDAKLCDMQPSKLAKINQIDDESTAAGGGNNATNSR